MARADMLRTSAAVALAVGVGAFYALDVFPVLWHWLTPIDCHAASQPRRCAGGAGGLMLIFLGLLGAVPLGAFTFSYWALTTWKAFRAALTITFAVLACVLWCVAAWDIAGLVGLAGLGGIAGLMSTMAPFTAVMWIGTRIGFTPEKF